MTITLADLVTRLAADVPAQSGVPTTAQYIQAIKDGVVDLGRRASVVRRAVLSIVAGTASYELPSDFVTYVRLSAIGVAYPQSNQGGTFVTPAGLVPFSGSFREQITVAGATLTIYPTPTFSADRTLVYAASDALDDAEHYPTLTQDRATIALLHARAACLDRIALSPAGAAVKITTGQDTVDLAASATALREQAAIARQQYLSAVASLNAGSGGLA